jgi:2-keto-4-pentenoate hydratase
MNDVHPRVVAATRVQLASWRGALDRGAGRVGWKIGHAIAEVEQLIGDRPVIGHLTTASMLPGDGAARFSAAGCAELRAETEVVLVLRHDVSPDASVGEAVDAIGGVAVGLELVDVARPDGGLEGIIAANVFHRAVAIGPSATVPVQPGAQGRLLVDGSARDAAAVPPTYGPVVLEVARILAAVDEQLSASDRILTGSLAHVPVAAGDHVTAEVDGLDRVAVLVCE